MITTLRTVVWQPTVDTAPYAPGDVIVSSSVALNTAGFTSGRVTLSSVVGAEDGGQAPALSLLFFSSQPGQSGTQNNPVTWGSADDTRFCGAVRIASGDWYTVGGKSFLHLPDLNLDMRVSQGSPIYMVAIADNAYDAVAADDLSLTLHFSEEV